MYVEWALTLGWANEITSDIPESFVLHDHVSYLRLNLFLYLFEVSGQRKHLYFASLPLFSDRFGTLFEQIQSFTLPL